MIKCIFLSSCHVRHEIKPRDAQGGRHCFELSLRVKSQVKKYIFLHRNERKCQFLHLSVFVLYDKTQIQLLAVATISSPGRSSAGTLGVFSSTANSLRMLLSCSYTHYFVNLIFFFNQFFHLIQNRFRLSVHL